MDLSAMLTAQRVRANVTVSDWQEAVRAVGKLLVSSRGVEERYVEAMIETVRELGPYIVIAPGIALPHAAPDAGVIEPSLALITLNPPVEFGNPDNDPVSLVIAFASPDKSTHMQALRELAMILSDAGNCERLKSARTEAEILRVMRSIPPAQQDAGECERR